MLALSGPFFGRKSLGDHFLSLFFTEILQQEALIPRCLAAVQIDTGAFYAEFFGEYPDQCLVGFSLDRRSADRDFQGVCMDPKDLVP